MSDKSTRRPNRHRVFLSYSRSNRRACQTAFDLLRDAGHEVWWDVRRLKGGDFVWETIFERIRVASSFVVLLSEKALRSPYVKMEVDFACERQRSGELDAFVPLKVRPCAAEVDPRFKERVIINATRGLSSAREKILSALPRTLSTRMGEARIITPREYFDFVMPAMLRWYGEAALEIGASVYFNLYDKRDQKWTLVLKQPEAKVLHGKVGAPDLEIHITHSEMVNMVTGFFDAKNAIAKGNLHLAGNLEFLRQIGELFSGRRRLNPPIVE